MIFYLPSLHEQLAAGDANEFTQQEQGGSTSLALLLYNCIFFF